MGRGTEHDTTYTDAGWVCACGDGEDGRVTGASAYQIQVGAEHHGEYFGGPVRRADR